MLQPPVFSKKQNGNTASHCKSHFSKSHVFRLRSQTLYPRLKGGGTNPSPWSGFAMKKKKQTSMFAFFSLKGGILPPRHYSATAGLNNPARLLGLHQSMRTPPTVPKSDTLSQNSVVKRLFANPPYRKRNGGRQCKSSIYICVCLIFSLMIRFPRSYILRKTCHPFG